MKRLRLRLVTALFCLGLMLSASATPSTAGVVPWVWNVLFGPSCSGSYCGGCGLTSCGGCYAPSPSYRAPMYSAPVYSAPAYSAPVYTPASPTYSAPVDSYPGGESTGCLPCVSETVVAGSTIYDGQPVLSGAVISSYSPTVVGESYIGDSYVTGSVVQSGCSPCAVGCGTTTYLGETIVEGSIIEGSIVEGSITEKSVVEGLEPNTFEPGSSTETMDAVGPTTEDAPDDSVNNESVGSEDTEPKVVDPDEPVIGGGRRRSRTGEDASGIGEVPDFVDPVDPNDTERRERRGINEDDPLFRESNKVVDPGDPSNPDGDAASPDADAEPSGSDTVPSPDGDTNAEGPDNSVKRHSDTRVSVLVDEAQPLDYEIRVRPIRGFPVRTMTARRSSQSTSNGVTVNAPFVLNKSKQTPLRWISIPRTTQIR